MTTELRAMRCARHAERDAAARCPACGGFFCRECVVDHGGRLLCASCLAREVTPESAAVRRRWARLRGLASIAAAVTLLWTVFFCSGELYLIIAR
jgi:hypothetical protein